MNILLADDHAIVRSGLRRIVSDAYPEATIDEVSSCAELRQKVQAGGWSVLVLDVALGAQNSLDIVPDLRQMQPQMSIVVLSMYGERQFVIRALRAGVSAYLTKERAPEELLKAIESVMQGKRYVDESVALQIAEYVALTDSSSTELHKQLSAREYEVFLLLASARSVSDIASQLHLSVKTISTYRTRILEKMGLRSNAELMRYALQHGLLQ